MGPTAVGKTDVAIRLARQLGTEILSADSRQCYADMRIGTARPTTEQLQAVRHHFIDEFPVEIRLTAADYEQYALQCLKQIFATHRHAVVCGGTGLYINALCAGLDEMPPVAEEVTMGVENLYETEGIAGLQAAIELEDPGFFASGEIHNPHRVMRALAFVRTHGKSIQTFRSGTAKKRDFRIVKIGLELERSVLYSRIEQRVDAMMTEGLLEEARVLFPKKELKNLQTVGYTELFDHFDGKMTLAQATEKIKQHTRNYAKRQMTWFRKDPDVIWFKADAAGLLEHILELGQIKH